MQMHMHIHTCIPSTCIRSTSVNCWFCAVSLSTRSCDQGHTRMQSVCNRHAVSVQSACDRSSTHSSATEGERMHIDMDMDMHTYTYMNMRIQMRIYMHMHMHMHMHVHRLRG